MLMLLAKSLVEKGNYIFYIHIRWAEWNRFVLLFKFKTGSQLFGRFAVRLQKSFVDYEISPNFPFSFLDELFQNYLAAAHRAQD